MLIILQLLPYFLLIVGVLGVVAFSSTSDRLRPYRRGLTLGLVASPLGFVLPYLAFMAIVALCHGTWPTDGVPVIDPIARVLVPSLFLLGPVIGPPLVVLLVTIRCRKIRKA